MLKVSTVLIENHCDKMVDHRKDLIKFAWHYLNAEDAHIKV